MSTLLDSPKTSRSNNDRKYQKEGNELELNPIKHSYSPKTTQNNRKRPKLNSSSFKKLKASPKKENKKLTFDNDVYNNIKKEEKEKEKEKLNESALSGISGKSLGHFSSKNINKKQVRHVNFDDKLLITVVEVESYKRYNFLNTTRDIPKKSVSCKCLIF